MNNAAILEIAKEAALRSAEILTHYFGNAGITEKSTQDLVTQADIEAEELIRQIILSAFPDHDFLGEESGASSSSQAALWVVDPLDGTNNYAHGIPQFSNSIAFVRDGVPEVGVVYDPLRNELFHAIRNGGAFLNDRPIHVSAATELKRSIISTGFYYDRGEMMSRTLAAIHRLFEDNIRGIRRFGSAALDLAWVACGRFEGFFEYQLSPWDYAAGSLLVQEAGGQCVDRNGRPLELNSGSMIASNGKIHPSLVNLVAWDRQ